MKPSQGKTQGKRNELKITMDQSTLRKTKRGKSREKE